VASKPLSLFSFSARLRAVLPIKVVLHEDRKLPDYRFENLSGWAARHGFKFAEPEVFEYECPFDLRGCKACVKFGEGSCWYAQFVPMARVTPTLFRKLFKEPQE
jgi:hypothetical protein